MPFKELAADLQRRHRLDQAKRDVTLMPVPTHNRISYLDGHRGIAILLVVAFHTMGRWTDRVPFIGAAHFPLVEFGWLGVELFFLISGFVILMTLEKCRSAHVFIYRRWLRLFPAMVICSGLIFVTAGFFAERPGGAPTVEQLLPGLTFMELSWWPRVFGHPMKSLEGSFWSLFVEFKFYVFAAIAYFLGGRRLLFLALVCAFALDFASNLVALLDPAKEQDVLRHVLGGLPFGMFGWFASGAAFYVFTQSGSRRWMALALALAVAGSAHQAFFGAAAKYGNSTGILIAALLVSAFFAASTVSKPLQRVLSIRHLQFFGFISYPLYLIHENMAIALLIKLGHVVPSPLLFLTPIIAMAPIVLVAYFVAEFAEPWLREAIGTLVNRSTRKAGQPLGQGVKAS